MPPLKETRLQIQERNRREIRQRTNKRIAELAQETENKSPGSSKTVQEDEIDDKREDKIEDKMEDKKEEMSGLFVSRLCRVCLCGVFVVFLVILSMFVWSVGFHLGLKMP